MKPFTKLVNGFQLLTTFPKTFFLYHIFDWFLSMPLMTTSFALSFKKRTFSFHIHLIFINIDFRINMVGNKYKWTQKFENVQVFIKCTLQYIYNMLQYELSFPVPSNEKLHNEILNNAQNRITKCATCCTIKLLKNSFFFVFWFCKTGD